MIAVGKIGKPHGIKGEVFVLPLTEFPEIRFAPGSVLQRSDGGPLTVEGARIHGQRRLLRIEGIADRNGAESLRDTMLYVDATSLPDLPSGRWWPHELEGCDVVTDTGRSLGAITEIVDTPANDMWISFDGEREWLIPVLDSTVLQVNLAERVVTVADIPGLTTEEE